LWENGVKVVFDSEIGVIVVAWGHHAHGKLGRDLPEVEFGIEALPLLHIDIHAFLFVIFV
jgi:hypothetical protein